MEWGDKLEFLEGIEAETGVAPKALKARPQLASHLGFIWEAFWSLSTDRPTGFSVGRIPFRSIDAYAARYRVDDLDSFDRLRHLVMAMDRAFVGHVNKPRK